MWLLVRWLWSNCRRVLYGKFNFMLLYGNLIFDLNPYFCMPLKLLMLWHDPKIWTKKNQSSKIRKIQRFKPHLPVWSNQRLLFYAPNAFINFDLGGVLFFQTFFTTIFLEGKNQHMWLETKKKVSQISFDDFSLDFWPSYFRRIWGSYVNYDAWYTIGNSCRIFATLK